MHESHVRLSLAAATFRGVRVQWHMQTDMVFEERDRLELFVSGSTQIAIIDIRVQPPVFPDLGCHGPSLPQSIAERCS